MFKRFIALLRPLVFRQPQLPPQTTERPQLVCRCCGAPMVILKRRIPATSAEPAGLVVEAKT